MVAMMQEWHEDEEGAIVRLPVDKLMEYRDTLTGHQRKLRKERVEELLEDFEPRAVGIPTVSRRADGSLWLMDGQHRTAALRRLGVKTVRCLVHDNLSEDDEKYLWALLNGGNPAKGLKRWHGLLGGHHETQDIDRIVRLCGYEVPTSYGAPAPNAIQATGALKWVYDRGGADALTKVLTTIRTVYPNNPRAVCVAMIYGVHTFFELYSDTVNRKRLMRLLAATPFEALMRSASELSNAAGRGAYTQVAAALLVLYNKGLKEEQRLDFGKIMAFSGGASNRTRFTADGLKVAVNQ